MGDNKILELSHLEVADNYYSGSDTQFNDILFDMGNNIGQYRQNSSFALSSLITVAFIRAYACGCLDEVFDNIKLYFGGEQF